MGPLEEGIAHRVFHRDGRIHLASSPIVEELDTFLSELRLPSGHRNRGLLLVGRREVRSCNSWLHNVPQLVSGKERCVLHVHPDDAVKAGLSDGKSAYLESRVRRGLVRVAICDDLRPGVVSLPHGWGHHANGTCQNIASARPGVSMNDWTDESQVEAVVGQSILSGIPVQLRPAPLTSDDH